MPVRSVSFGATTGVMSAMAVTVIDGFDAFSLSLAAPDIGAELGLGPATMGTVFAAAMGGMIIGALASGGVAKRLGQVRALALELALFGAMALLLTTTHDGTMLVVNRLIAGIGLGGAAPIAVGLLNRREERPSDLVISIVWSGLPIGGVLAAGFKYFLVVDHGWRSMFMVGGVAPIVAALAIAAAARHIAPVAQRPATESGAPPSLLALLAAGRRGRTLLICLMFFFGYVTTSMIAYWLPTIMTHERAAPALVSGTFAALNVGGALGQYLLGYVSARFGTRRLLAGVWVVTGGLAAGAAMPFTTLNQLAILAAASASFAAGAQGLSVALANRVFAGTGLETGMIGAGVGAGRIGQFASLGLAGALIGAGAAERDVILLAGVSACLAGAIAFAMNRPAAGQQIPT